MTSSVPRPLPLVALLAGLSCVVACARAADIAALDTDHDGRLSRAEVASHAMLSRHFDEIDADHDGYLTPDELRAYRQARKAARAGGPPPGAAPMGGPPPGAAPMGGPPPVAAPMGGPPPGAAPAGPPPGAAPAGPGGPGGAMSTAAAGPGPGEAPAGRKGGGGNRLFQKVDANGNGVIERAEAESNRKLSGHFDEVDTNHDGVITPDELEAAMARRGGHKGGTPAAVNSSPAMQVGPAPGAPGAAPAAAPAPAPAPTPSR